jgi:hypothetical protein
LDSDTHAAACYFQEAQNLIRLEKTSIVSEPTTI